MIYLPPPPPLLAALAAAALFFASSPAHANVFYYYKNATSAGCTATFLVREFYATDPSGNGTTYTKVGDTCGLYTANDDANFAGMGFCPSGRVVEGVHCNGGGYVVRTTYEHVNCFKQVLAEVTPQFCYGDTLN